MSVREALSIALGVLDYAAEKHLAPGGDRERGLRLVRAAGVIERHQSRLPLEYEHAPWAARGPDAPACGVSLPPPAAPGAPSTTGAGRLALPGGAVMM